MQILSSRQRLVALVPALLALAGCDAVVLSPSGHVAAQQRDLLVLSTLLMLLIVVPVMAMAAAFAWRYRAGNAKARYAPDWDHSMRLELLVWSVPLLIIICLGAATWAETHLLDPYRPLDRIDRARPADPAAPPLQVNVVALDWKWLFIYPELGIATVNEMAAPVDRPIRFSITASSVMNAFYVPALAGQIYAMPGMTTTLHAVINRPGDYKGFSANYSGDGFSDMRFTFKARTAEGFARWVETARTGGRVLDAARYLDLARPSVRAPVMRFGTVAPLLWRSIVNMCVDADRMCMDEMMALDAAGGLGLAGLRNTLPLPDGAQARRGTAAFGGGRSYLPALCTPEDRAAAWSAVPAGARDAQPTNAPSMSRLAGSGLPVPRAPHPARRS